MEFRGDCGSLMTPQDGVWVHPNDHEKARDSEGEKSMVMTESQGSSEVVDMSDVNNTDIDPTTEVICPRCGHDVACYEMKQVRSADESEARFFTCVRCNHK